MSIVKNPFKLEKLHIEAYRRVERTPNYLADSMKLMFNPESFKEQYGIAYQAPKSRRALNSPATPATYAFTPPSELSFTFILDGTGVDYFFGVHSIHKKLKGKSVSKEIEKFKDICYYYNGEEHQPHFLKVRWGNTLNFSCRLKALNITYKLLDRDGNPIRAELDVTFVQDEDEDKINRKARKSSPDLTHVRTVKSGDTLPLLCKQIYGSSTHYLMIARTNNLDDFRNLIPGQQISFPPLQNDQRNN